MADILIEDLPKEVAAALEMRAARVGMSIDQYVRRLLVRDTAPHPAVGAADIAWFAGCFADLADPEVMARAWQ